MKWAIVLLLISGIGAAVCAAVLVGSLKADQAIKTQPRDEGPREIEVLVARKALPAMTVVSADMVETKTVPITEAPAAGLSSSVQVVGKVLKVPLVEGQAFTRDCFATRGSGVHLIAALEEGKRAMSVVLPDYSALDGLLYPGSVVDVLASFRTPSKDLPREAVSTTLLEGIQVLAIEEKTVVSATLEEEQEQEHDPNSIRSGRRSQIGRRKIMITLLVDSKQAKVLQLAIEHGSVSLALRNPLDERAPDQRMASLGELIGKRRRAAGDGMGLLARNGSSGLTSAFLSAFGKGMAKARPAGEDKNGAAEKNGKKMWETTVIRGREVEKVLLPMPADDAPDGEKGRV